MTASHPGVTEADARASSASLPADLTIYTVGEMHGRMQAWPAESPTLRVDAAAVAEVDSAGVQLLMSLHRTASQRGQQLELADAAPVLVETCRRLGAAFLFEPRGAVEAAP